MPCGFLWTTSIKKSLVGLPVQLGSYVPNARTHVSKTPDVWAIMGLQDVWTSGYSATPALLATRGTLLQCQATHQGSVIWRTVCSMTGQDVLLATEDIICYS
jgi:hypothetical protein